MYENRCMLDNSEMCSSNYCEKCDKYIKQEKQSILGGNYGQNRKNSFINRAKTS